MYVCLTVIIFSFYICLIFSLSLLFLLLFSFFFSTPFVPSFFVIALFFSYTSLLLSLLSLPPSLPLSPHSVCMVSCVTKEGVRDLQDRIHAAALNAKDPDTHEHVIGMQVHCVYVCVCVCVSVCSSY